MLKRGIPLASSASLALVALAARVGAACVVRAGPRAELVNEAKEWGGNVHPVECLNVDEQWCRDFAEYTFTQAEGSAQDKEDLEYRLDDDAYLEMPTLELQEAGFSISKEALQHSRDTE